MRILSVLFLLLVAGCSNDDWRTASRAPAGIAIDPTEYSDAVIEAYAANAYGWRGIFAVHTWLAVKPENAKEYTVYEVVGWRLKRGLPALHEYQTATPDRYWYGAKPKKFLSLTGEQAKELIPKIAVAVSNYPWSDEYTVFPGPNSNTFPAWVGKQVPELQLDMPFRAIGSGYAE
ncbi:DUF3750 domain-containing protein [Vibrio sp.]|uniref:DUF3750 domain-containing protein n=1 Tax=Vibrio viridaestus TaxID=2487322 RepID=A0A3N9TGT0_9VIBR|nr:DUF3750 domain-containing protein [Vibrio viridaestus]MDC0612577.1 DUF3750 domain-containing protein [Vibrio sp.]RQW63488.1 DUF3750 domain-containing protein [Vibrio viridaestus]